MKSRMVNERKGRNSRMSKDFIQWDTERTKNTHTMETKQQSKVYRTVVIKS